MTTSNAINHYENVPDIVKRFVDASGEIGKAGLEPKLRHRSICVHRRLNQCAYCVKMHTQEALDAGETQERLQRLTVWRHVDDYTPAEKAAFAWTEALTSLQVDTNYEALRGELRRHFDDAEISAITAAVAMINLWNRVQVSNH